MRPAVKIYGALLLLCLVTGSRAVDPEGRPVPASLTLSPPLVNADSLHLQSPFSLNASPRQCFAPKDCPAQKSFERAKPQQGAAADPDDVAPVQIMLCGSDAIDALFSSSQMVRRTLITDWGRGIYNFTSSLEGKQPGHAGSIAKHAPKPCRESHVCLEHLLWRRLPALGD